MPQITTTFIDLLMYIAPGYVLLYSLRHYFPAIEKFIGPDGQPANNIETLVPMLLMTVSSGVVLAGISTLLTRLGRLVLCIKGRGKMTRKERIVMFRRVLNNDIDKLKLFWQYTRTAQTSASMTIALIISFIVLIYNNILGVKSFSEPKIFILSFFIIMMIGATIFSYRTVYDIMAALSETPEETTQDGQQ